MQVQWRSVEFEWDDEKNRINILKHGFDFNDGWQVFQNPMLARLDTRKDYGEDRWVATGTLQGRAVVLVFAQRGENIIRIISMRKANRHERTAYEKAIKN